MGSLEANMTISAGPPTPPRRGRLAPEEYVEGVLAQKRGILSRVITLIESERHDDRQLARHVLDALVPEAGKSIRLGITGVPGAGKSTLIEALGLNLLAAGHRVAVLAIDPSSRLTGGSILGDKTRMAQLSLEDNAFVRPSPSGRTLGGVASNTREAMLVCEAAGFDVVIIETVGVGQSETSVAEMVDTFLAVLIAGAGDELQGIKRGLIEMIDLLAINKADGANVAQVQRAANQYRNVIRLMHPPEGPWIPTVLTCSALTNTGLDELWSAVRNHQATMKRTRLFEERRRTQSVRWMWDLVNQHLHSMLREHPSLRELSSQLECQVAQGQLTPSTAADRITAALGRPHSASTGPLS